jgi:hypothetical protein
VKRSGFVQNTGTLLSLRLPITELLLTLIVQRFSSLRGTKQSRILHGRRTLHTVTAETSTLRAALERFVASLLAKTEGTADR